MIISLKMIFYLFTLASLLAGSLAESEATRKFDFILSETKIHGIKEAREYCTFALESKIASDISGYDWKEIISMIPPENGNKIVFNTKVFKVRGVKCH